MEIYSTEEQQVEAIKSFWSKYGNAIIGGVVVGLASIYGWNWYQSNQKAEQEAQSLAYQDATENLSVANSEQVQTFIESEADSGYASLAALQLAKSFVEAGELTQASTQLKWVADNSNDPALIDLATYRLARVLIASGDSEQALALVQQPETTAFTAQFSELKGDILLEKGDESGARSAYQTAADNDGLAGNPGLKMKLDNLAQDNGTVSL
ncbi:YfgM family protein [Catenovulum adriaticum]|uniref:Ancillary SecYEG translocon subunit n=1 Tax=Catenovulum adriaticum TaxID=2984846 RepID=A0ABY7AI72_9ALTE|nr:tetratricopeptide repeat protein [Catenovulum sp. TS8]WAJ69015.1 tetratricopeptide repeat protein [Catenovulum sp. TS8]